MKKLIVLGLATLILVSGTASFSGVNANEKTLKLEKHSKAKKEAFGMTATANATSKVIKHKGKRK